MTTLFEFMFPKVRAQRVEIAERKAKSAALLERAKAVAAKSEAIYQEQKIVSDALREEQRKNHFAELFTWGVPVKPKDNTND